MHPYEATIHPADYWWTEQDTCETIGVVVRHEKSYLGGFAFWWDWLMLW